MSEADAASRLRHALVDSLVDHGAITTEPVEAAMRAVPRHRLLREVWIPGTDGSADTRGMSAYSVDPARPARDVLQRVYSNVPIVTRMKDGRPTSSTSQPSLVAQMLELLELRPGMRVLEIGAGTGYNAALIAEVVGSQELVTTVDIQPDVVDQTRSLLADAGYPAIRVVCDDGALGSPDGAPFDRVVATVGCTDVAPAWLEQLAPSGFLLIPLEHFTVGHPLTRVARVGSTVDGRVLGPAGFMRIEGSLNHTGPRRNWGAGVHRGEPRRSRLPDELAPVTGWAGSGWHFLYYLRLADARSGPGLMLADADGSVRVEFNGSELLETGETNHLRSDLLDHVAAWHDLGSPAASAWNSTFLPVGSGTAADAPYRVERLHYTQVATLS